MASDPPSALEYSVQPTLKGGTLILSFSGWMDGGEVSTGTVRRLIDLLEAKQFAEIDIEPFYILNFPGSMEIAAMFRPAIEIEDGLVQRIDMPSNVFYFHAETNLALFVGKEPNMRWPTFAECIFDLTRRSRLKRILFVGSFGGAVPHTRQPRLYVTCSNTDLVEEMRPYGVRRTGYAGPGSFTSYLLTQAAEAGIEMVSLVAEIPGYLQGENPSSIEAVTRRLVKMLRLPLSLDSLRAASTQWELQVSSAIEENAEMSAEVRKLEEAYDNDLLDRETGSEE